MCKLKDATLKLRTAPPLVYLVFRGEAYALCPACPPALLFSPYTPAFTAYCLSQKHLWAKCCAAH